MYYFPDHQKMNEPLSFELFYRNMRKVTNPPMPIDIIKVEKYDCWTIYTDKNNIRYYGKNEPTTTH